MTTWRKKNGGEVSPSNGNIANSNSHMSDRSSYMIEHDLENQQEVDTCHKVTETCKAGGSMENSKFVEFWVPVPISNVQLEQYCATLLTNAMALRSSSKLDPLGTLKDTFLTNRKCCNHPYTVDPKVQQSLMEDKDQSMVIEVGTKASGKLQFLDHILPEIQKHQRKVLILFQHTSGSLSLGHILVDFVHRRFGQNSYQLVNGPPNTSSKKLAAIYMFNKDISRFIFLLESRACHQSIKLSSVDAIIIFDSDLNPSNDFKSLQKLSINSQSEQIMIFRLYSLSTLEEKILKLPEINVTRDIRSQSLRTNYDALLMWGASDLFDKLTKFHNQTVVNISSEESFLKDVVEEFLYILSHKCKNNDTTSKSIITRIQNCGIYGKNNALHSEEIKTRLPNGDEPYIFWRKLLEGRCPAWKFVSQSTPRQRKRPNYCLDSDSPPRRQIGVDGGDVKTRKMTVYISNVEPARSKTVTEGETGRVNDESRSSSGNRFLPTTVNNETSLLDFLKPTVSELCNILKFSEDVKIVVETFLEFVVDHYKVSKEHPSILQAFMISLCWIGSSLAKNKIDRSELFALAKKHFDFSCTEEQAESVYKKLKQVKETFLERTQVRPVLPENPEVAPTLPESPIEAQSHDEPVCEGANDIESTGSHTSEKETVDATVSSEQIGEVPAQQLDDDMDANVAGKVNSSHAVEKLKRLEREFANKLEELEKLWENGLEEIKVTTLAAIGQVAAENEFSLHGSQSEVESADMGMPAGTCDKENTEDGEINLDTSDEDGDDHNQTSRIDALPHVESAEVATPAVNEEKAEDNCSFCSDSGNPVCAANSQDKTSSVQTVSSPASDNSFQEIQNEPLQLEPLPESGVQDEETNDGNLQPSGASQRDWITRDDEPDILSSTDPMVAENPSDTLPPSGPLLEPLVNALDVFDKLTNGVSPQMQDQTDPLQAEVEWLYTEKDNVTKFHQETKQRLDTECEKEIAEIVAKIRLKYEAKHVEADTAYNSEKTELETNIKTVIMSRVLAEAFRCKCHNLIPSGDPSKDMEKLK